MGNNLCICIQAFSAAVLSFGCAASTGKCWVSGHWSIFNWCSTHEGATCCTRTKQLSLGSSTCFSQHCLQRVWREVTYTIRSTELSCGIQWNHGYCPRHTFPQILSKHPQGMSVHSTLWLLHKRRHKWQLLQWGLVHYEILQIDK